MVPQVRIPTAEFVIPTGTQTNETAAGIETQPVPFGAKISKSLT